MKMMAERFRAIVGVTGCVCTESFGGSFGGQMTALKSD